MPRSIAIIAYLVSSLLYALGRHVEVDVSASWPRFSTSFITEIGEFLAEEEDHSTAKSPYWRFQDEICKISQEMSDLSQLNSVALEAALKLLPVSSHSLLEVQLGLGYYAPAVEFYHNLAQPFAHKASEACQFFEGNQAFVVLGSRVLCSASEVDVALSATSSHPSDATLHPSALLEPQSCPTGEDDGTVWDHVYISSSTSSSDKGVLFGSYASTSFCSLLEALKRHTDGGRLTSFAVRPAFHGLAPLSATSSLQGYGVFLDIKNMEYKNVDDVSAAPAQSEDKADRGGAEEVFDVEEEVQGVNFHKLRQHNPSMSEEIAMLRHSLRSGDRGSGSGTSSEGEMKVWRMKDFGLQLLQLTSSLAAKETAFVALMKAKEWVHNFPKYASMISSTKVTSSLKQAMTSLYHHPLVNALPTNVLFVNDRRVELGGNTFNVYDVLSVVREQIRHVTRLHSLHLSASLTHLLKNAVVALTSEDSSDGESDSDDVIGGVGGSGGEVAALEKDILRIDVSQGGKYVVHFLNNLDKDKLYSKTLGWPKTLTSLLYPSWNLHTIARNLYTLVVHVDVISPNTVTLLQAVRMLYQEQFPMRLGVAPYCGKTGEWRNDVSEEEALRMQVCRLYASMLGGDEGSAVSGAAVLQAADFLEKVGVSVANGGTLDIDHLLALYSESSAGSGRGSALTMTSAADMKKRLLETDDFMHFVRNSTIYYTERNLPTSCFSFNGIVVTDDVSITSSLMRLVGREQYLLSHYVRARKLSDKSKSIFADVMKISGAFSRYHGLLQDKKPHYLPSLLASTTSTTTSLSLADRVMTSLPRSLTTFLAPFLSSNTTSTSTHTLFGIFPLSREGLTSAHALLSSHLLKTQTSTTEVEGVPGESEKTGEGKPKAHTQIALAWRPVTPSTPLCKVEVGGVGSCVGQGMGKTEADVAVVLQHFLHLLAGESKVCTRECVEVVQHLLATYVTHTPKSDEHPLEEVLRRVSEVIESSSYTGVDRQRMSAYLSSLHTSSEEDREAQRLSLVEEYRKIEKSFQLKPSTSSVEVVVIFNNRILATSSFHPLDVDLLTSVELKKIDKKALHRLFKEVDKKTQPQTSSDVTLTSLHTSSMQKFALLNFLWNSASPASSASASPTASVQRFDLQETMSEMYPPDDPTATSLWASTVYQIEPLLSVDNDRYWQNGNDLSITLIIDPLSLAGQRGLSLVELLREHLHYTTSVVLLPKLEITDFPLQQFYRFLLTPATTLSHYLTTSTTTPSNTSVSVKAVFSSLPRQHVLTTRLDVAELWNVQTSAAVQDIDNLRCSAATGCGDGISKSKEVTSVSFSLKNLLVSGQCFQTTEEVEVEEGSAGSGNSAVGSPPNGLQLTLSSLTSLEVSGRGEVSDTLVMQNLGYYQLQSRTPSLYLLSLSPGKSSYLYRIRGSGERGGQLIAIKSFNDRIRRLVVVKRSGREHLSLLDTSSEEEAAREVMEQGSDTGKGFWENLKSSIFGTTSSTSSSVVKVGGEGEEEVMHIFSLATGHLYERFLRIMMLSVVKHASLRVKFWLFENYLSPTFKDVAAVMSARYGFDIGYVTYKWPQWLRQQTQQQRIIWGYKILFLDVLFPLHVTRVIYVDADQVVRADLKELWHMDLHGAPYAYTPFCTSREETLGFQFWRSGYWKDHLQGRPYHISALYVVDLQTFRRQMVGDQLRAIYDQLSRDPNSLANLDQDLPNYAQHQVPIFSLPQHWLWCETWCSDKSKGKAKTIDLCNNPLHKEPKLDMAKRIISGKLFNESWVQIDEEIAALTSA